MDSSRDVIAVISCDDSVTEYLRELVTGREGRVSFIGNSDDIHAEIEKSKPRCILVMNGTDGAGGSEAYGKIREHPMFVETPVIILSFEDKKSESLELDKNLHFLKIPIRPEQLEIEIDKAINDRMYVLMVDDSPIIHTMLKEMLAGNNFGVIEAYDGVEALGILRTIRPDIIISDIEMPKMDGYEFCRQVKENPGLEGIPFLILSSLGSGIDVDRGFNAGANDYLTKPIDPEELINRLNNLLAKSVRSTRETVLVVDDSSIIRSMMIQGLEQQGFKVFSAVDGKDGLEKAREIMPDMITSDYDMPVMNGWEFCQALQKDEELKDIPVVMCTSRDSKADRAKSIGTGVKSYLSKPFTMDKLMAVIERVLAEKRMQREREVLKFYVSDAALEAASMQSHGRSKLTEMRAKEMFATVLFSDIVKFTPTCEKLAPKELITLLNEYFDLMCTILKKNNAIIDKFIGDAIMAIFGKAEDGAFFAVKSGFEMIQSLSAFNEGRDTPIKIRVGINSGKLFIGDIGSKLHRRDFTVIGATVNMSQRLESNSPALGVLISEVTYNLVKDRVKAERIGPLVLKGISTPQYAYVIQEVTE